MSDVKDKSKSLSVKLVSDEHKNRWWYFDIYKRNKIYL